MSDYKKLIDDAGNSPPEKPAETPATIRAPLRETDRARIEFNAIPASELGDGENVDWVWHGFLARGFITLLIGLWKAGKSTMLAHLLKAMAEGGELAGEVNPGRVLVCTEEGAGLWARRRDDVGFQDNATFVVRPFKIRPNALDWRDFVEWIADRVKADNIGAVVLDTWSAFNPTTDENDASGMMAALLPLHLIAEAGAAVLIVHHPKKGDGAEAQASRGSGALTGFVDIIVELRRFCAESSDDRRRTLRCYSRFDESPPEVVVELGDDGYRTIGSKGDASRNDRQQVIDDILTEDSWKTAATVRDEWPEGAIPKPSKRTVQLDLTHGAENDRWLRQGNGVRNDPYTYKFDSRTPHPLRHARNSNSNGNGDFSHLMNW